MGFSDVDSYVRVSQLRVIVPQAQSQIPPRSHHAGVIAVACLVTG